MKVLMKEKIARRFLNRNKYKLAKHRKGIDKLRPALIRRAELCCKILNISVFGVTKIK